MMPSISGREAPRRLSPTRSSVHRHAIDVVACPELGEELRDHQVAAMRTLARRADEPVRGHVIRRALPIGQGNAALRAGLGAQALELAIEDGVKLRSWKGGPAHATCAMKRSLLV